MPTDTTPWHTSQHTTEDFRAALQSAGLTPGEVVADGVLHRCPTADKPAARDGWFVLFSDPPAGAFGNWRTGEKHTWIDRSPGVRLEMLLEELT